MDPIIAQFRSRLVPGAVLHVRRRWAVGWMVRRALGSWGDHDGLFCYRAGEWWSGDARPRRAKWISLSEYITDYWQGRVELRAYVPAGYTMADGHMAVRWWDSHVLGTPYDYAAFPRLIAKCIVGDVFPWPVGFEWSFYCTESVRDSWREGAVRDIYGKNNPTPRTTEKRAAAGGFALLAELLQPQTPSGLTQAGLSGGEA